MIVICHFVYAESYEWDTSCGYGIISLAIKKHENSILGDVPIFETARKRIRHGNVSVTYRVSKKRFCEVFAKFPFLLHSCLL